MTSLFVSHHPAVFSMSGALIDTQPTPGDVNLEYFMLMFPSYLSTHDARGGQENKPLHKLSLPGMSSRLIRGCRCISAEGAAAAGQKYTRGPSVAI